VAGGAELKVKVLGWSRGSCAPRLFTRDRKTRNARTNCLPHPSSLVMTLDREPHTTTSVPQSSLNTSSSSRINSADNLSMTEKGVASDSTELFYMHFPSSFSPISASCQSTLEFGCQMNRFEQLSFLRQTAVALNLVVLYCLSTEYPTHASAPASYIYSK